MRAKLTRATALLLAAFLSGPALAAACHNGASFEQWLEALKRDASAQGISQATIASALPAMTFDASIVRRDRGQGVFQQSFLQFSDRMVSANRLQVGARQLKTQAALFDRIEKQFGVPGPVLTAFWGLETDFGSNIGKTPILRSLATLAYDCRRPAFFRGQLLDALRLIQRGDLKAGEMLGDWAGEIGP